MGSPPGPVAGGAPHGCGAPPRTSPMSRRRASPLAPRRRTRPVRAPATSMSSPSAASHLSLNANPKR
eukprot:scaffold93335_cov54-Phaeocystis_antarctica.AAC.1